MDFVSPILDVVSRVWDCSAKHAAYINDLQENLESLRNEMLELKDVYQDVKGRIEREEQRQMVRRTNEVNGWLCRVQLLETQVDEILQKGDQEIQKKCFFGSTSCCPRNCVSSYKLGKKASEKIAAVTELRNRGRFDHVVASETLPQISPVDERPMQKTVGLDLMYEKVCRSIQDEQFGIIGLYGMGGAGKTTLMTKVNNEFITANKDFDIAIWVLVSRPASVEKVQEVIRNKLKIPDDIWRNRSQDEKAVEIFNVLKAKRVLMLLDDVWERLDLDKVGVPSPTYSQNKSKVVLTTRSLDVCHLMEAQKTINVECLTEEEAINLFKEKVGETTLNSHPDIPHLAEIAAKECKGLPLALVTIGRAMAGKNTPQQWERAIQTLKTYPSKLSGMGDHVFPILKFSYDNLPNDTIKACFSYLAMFPEDHSIYFSDLILLWIGEGFLDECDNIDDEFSQGRDVIDHLKTACLFESYEYDQIKMHDVIRDMALWLATTYSGNQNKILVEENDIVEVHQVAKWKEAQRMYLSFSSMAESSIPPSFPNLLTLIVNGGEGLEKFPEKFPSGFFNFMPIIKVLDLSGTGITKLPIGIGQLVTLEYLDLSDTSLIELSTELKALKKMRCLLLNTVLHLEMIPKEAISNLSMMRIFALSFLARVEKEEEKAKYSREDNQALYFVRKDNKALLEELEGLEHINYVTFQIECALSFEKLLSSQKLKNAMWDLRLGNLEGMPLLQLPRMKHLQRLRIYWCSELEEIKVDDQERVEGRRRFVEDCHNNIPANSYFCCLRDLIILELPKLLELTWLIYIPSLETLYVYDCESMVDVIGDVGDGVSGNLGIFSRLKYLRLDHLPNLRSIYRRALPFPCLTELYVSCCPKLRKLPLDSDSTTTTRNSLKEIVGESDWWKGLEWENETIRLTFTPYFRAKPHYDLSGQILEEDLADQLKLLITVGSLDNSLCA